MAVFVLDKQKRPLMPCTEKRARLLLKRGRAVVVRLAPFTIRLKDRVGGTTQPLRLKLDPGSRATGLAIVRESETCDPDTGAIERIEYGLWFGELVHRGQVIREALFATLTATGLPVETGPGGHTKFNRTRLGIPKTHALGAACVGAVAQVQDWNRPVLAIRAAGRGAYNRTRTFNNGFPRGYLMRHKRIHGFQTGDWVRAEAPTGQKAGVHVGRVAVRHTGSFNIQTPDGIVQGVSYRHCRVLQRADGYGYAVQPKPNTEVARRAA